MAFEAALAAVRQAKDGEIAALRQQIERLTVQSDTERARADALREQIDAEQAEARRLVAELASAEATRRVAERRRGAGGRADGLAVEVEARLRLRRPPPEQRRARRRRCRPNSLRSKLPPNMPAPKAQRAEQSWDRAEQEREAARARADAADADRRAAEEGRTPNVIARMPPIPTGGLLMPVSRSPSRCRRRCASRSRPRGPRRRVCVPRSPWPRLRRPRPRT